MIVAILDPFMVGGYGAPKLAFAPLFILWFGIGIESKIALVASVVFFIVYFTTLSGVRALDPQAGADGAGGRRERAPGRRATSSFPAAVPAIFAGFRIAVPYAIGGAVIAELISSNRGLGYLVQTGAMNFDTTRCSSRSSPPPSSFMPPSGCSTPPSGRCCAGGRRRRRVSTPGPEHERHAAARDQEPRQALSRAAMAASRRRG